MTQALLSGDRNTARDLLGPAPGDAASLARTYQRRLQPALFEIGRLWESSQITVADEHLASAIVESLLETQHAQLLNTPRAGCRAVVACTSGEWHQIGSKMVANILESCGWDTDFLGADTPADDLTKFLTSRRIHLVALSAVLPELAPSLCSVVQELVQSHPKVSVVVGGSGLTEFSKKRLGQLFGPVHVSDNLEEFQAWLTSGRF